MSATMDNNNGSGEAESANKSSIRDNCLKAAYWLFVGGAIAAAHYYHVSNLFDSDRNFTYLSPLEREMSLRTEMGFYYSYYKTIVDERTFAAGLTNILYDKLVEHPKEVNAFNRFNIHPEVILGVFYNQLKPLLNSSKTCHIVNRGQDLSPVETCIGLGEPVFFYLEAIWWLAGLNAAALFFLAVTLSGSTLGGAVAVLLYFANHEECTRVMWTPNERENFAQPFLLLQMWLVTLQMTRPLEKRATLGIQIAILTINCVCLLFWQFTQFVFLTQIAIFFVMEQLHVIDTRVLCMFLHSHFCGVHMAILLLQGNDMLKTSLYVCMFVVVSFYALFFSYLRIKVKTRLDLIVESMLVPLRVALVVCVSLWAKQMLNEVFNVQDDSHIFDMLYSKFFDFKTFHTMLYTCSAVFDFLPLGIFYKFTVTGLLPLVVIALSNILYFWMHTAIVKTENCDAKDDKETKGGNKDEICSEVDDSGDDSGIENKTSRDETKRYENKDGVGSKAVVKNEEKSADVKKVDVKEEVEDVLDSWVVFLKNMQVDPGVFYNVSQMFVFGVMAAIVMRLKLLWTPHMCVVAGMATNAKFYGGYRKKHKFYVCALTVVFLTMAIYQAQENMTVEASNIGQFSDPSMEELLTWIDKGSDEGSTFAGPMPLTATVMLSTRRPIVNHPHYEHIESRKRNYAVYKTYGKFSPVELHGELTKLKATHLIVDRKYCYGRSGKGCSFEDIWDHEAPALKDMPRLCHTLLTQDVDNFYPVFENDQYTVLRVHDYSIRYKPKLQNT